jgi:hypothetical protein
MIHLTHSGSSGGRPLCNCHRQSHQAVGDSFLAVVYASSSLLASDELCIACRTVLDNWEEDVDQFSPTTIEWLDVEEIPPSVAFPMG